MSPDPIHPAESAETRGSGAGLRALAVLSLLGFAVATLWPAAEPAGEPAAMSGFFLADGLRNLALLVPFGVAAGALGVRAFRVAACAAALAIATELAQAAIPGRDPSALDVLANTTGAGLAAWLTAAAPRWLRPSRPRAFVALAALAIVCIASAPLLQPRPAAGAWFAHLDPVLGHLAAYEGRVVTAEIDGIALHHGAVADPDALRAALADGFRIRVSGVAGAAPDGQAALLLVTDARRETQLLLGPQGDDLVLRYRAGGTALGLEGMRLRSPAALSGLAPGDPLEVEAVMADSGVCLIAQGRRRCGLGPGLGDGWQLLAPDRALLDRARPLLAALWLGLLALPLGLFAAPRGAGLALWLAGLAVLAGLPVLAGLRPLSTAALAGALAGLLAGAALARSVTPATLWE